MKKDKDIISFAAGKTYEHILHTNIHAHPVKRGFPKTPTDYVMFRKSGGEMDFLFRVKKTVDLYVRDILLENVSPYGIDNLELTQIRKYVSERSDQIGFKYMTEYPYQFYLLEKVGVLSPPLFKIPNIQGYCYYEPTEIIDHLEDSIGKAAFLKI